MGYLQPIDPNCVIVKQLLLILDGKVLDDNLEAVKERGIAARNLVHRKVASKHAPFDPKTFDAVKHVRSPGLGKLGR
jgi:hypothetical protein